VLTDSRPYQLFFFRFLTKVPNFGKTGATLSVLNFRFSRSNFEIWRFTKFDGLEFV
jgi:hypothetical protein